MRWSNSARFVGTSGMANLLGALMRWILPAGRQLAAEPPRDYRVGIAGRLRRWIGDAREYLLRNAPKERTPRQPDKGTQFRPARAGRGGRGHHAARLNGSTFFGKAGAAVPCLFASHQSAHHCIIVR